MSSSSFDSSEYYESSSDSSDQETNVIAQRREMNNAFFNELPTKAATRLFDDGAEQSSAQRPRWRGPDQVRDREAAHERLFLDYFAENCNYNEETFERRFCMKKRLFLQIVEDLQREYPFFQHGWDARGRKGLSTLQKCTAGLCQMAYGISSDSMDDYLKMAESTARDCLHNFTDGIIKLYGKRYLRKPTYDDIQHLYAAHDSRHGFLDMFGSVDCMHWGWDKCSVAWRGQYMRGDHDRPTIMLEAVASQELWVWHAYFGVVESNNDLNVLNHSSLFDDVYNGISPQCPFIVNNLQYKHGYYLADGINPEWATFVKSFTCHIDKK